MTDPTAPPATATPLPRILIAVLALLSAVAPFATDMYLPGFPAMAEDLDASATAVQLTLTAFLIGLAVGQLVIGPLSDRFGRRRPLLLGTAVCFVASVLCALTPSVEVLVGLRFVQGFAGAAGVVLARAIIADRAHGPAAGRLFGMLMIIGSLALILGPLLGGAVISGGGWRAVFWAIAAINVLMLIGAVTVVPETLPADRRHGGGASALATNIRSVLGSRRYLGYTLTLACSFMVLFAYISASPFVLQNVIGLSSTTYSLVFGGFALCLTVVSAVAARLVTTVAPRRMLIGGVGAVVVCTFGLLLAVTVGGAATWPTLVLMLCSVSSLGMIFGNATALATAEVRHAAGTGSAVMGFLQFGLGALVSPIVGLAGEENAAPMGIVMFVAAALAATALLTLTRGHAPEHEHVATAEPALQH